MINKGIILAAGRSTRLYPATMVLGKQLLPIFDKPMIYYPLSILMQAGIREICVVSNPHDLSLFAEMLGHGEFWGIHIEYRVQYEPRGIADVFNVAKDFIDHQPSALILGDNLFIGEQMPKRLETIQSQDHLGAHLVAFPVESPERYGVLSLNAKGEIEDILEKPEQPPSNLAVTGLYFYDAFASTLAQELKPSARGELEITDLNRLYLQQKKLQCTILNAADDQWFDTGTHESMYQANCAISTLVHEKHQQVGCLEEIAYLKQWITTEELSARIQKFRHTSYGKYLNRYLKSHA